MALRLALLRFAVGDTIIPVVVTNTTLAVYCQTAPACFSLCPTSVLRRFLFGANVFSSHTHKASIQKIQRWWFIGRCVSNPLSRLALVVFIYYIFCFHRALVIVGAIVIASPSVCFQKQSHKSSLERILSASETAE